MSTTNLEEAATIAAEFISSLDNLPAEVQHLLAEIRHKDTKVQELQQEITRESSKYFRHSLKQPAQPLSPKDQAIPQLVKEHYAEIDRLSDEKIALAEKIVRLLSRAKIRLEEDLQKVLILQGDEPPTPALSASYTTTTTRTPLTQVVEDLRTHNSVPIISSVAAPTVHAAPTPAAPPPAKRPRITAGTIKMPSPAPTASSTPTRTSTSTAGGTTATTSQRASRLSQQVHPRQSPSRTSSRRAAASVGPDPDEDAEGEEEPEDAAEDMNQDEMEEDKGIYCFCRKMSYGEMIACDNEDCRYQWFHLNCVSLKAPLPERWFCSECGGAATGNRKGRKK